MRKFVLIGGMPRSGTNLLRRIIGSHSKIAIPPGEPHFFEMYREGKSVGEILAHERLKQWNMDFSSFCSLAHREAYVKVLAHYAEKTGKEIPGEKTPLNEFYYDLAQDWLKDYELKFLQLVRNPFDVLASYKYAPFRRDERGEEFNVPAKCEHWRRSVSLGLARAHANPKGYCVVKYENLTDDPVGNTQKLCEFLGVAFEEERMLKLSDFVGHVDNTSFHQVPEKDRKSYAAVHQLESRKQHLTAAERGVIGSFCGELALALGYDDPDFRHPPSGAIVGLLKKFRYITRKYTS